MNFIMNAYNAMRMLSYNQGLFTYPDEEMLLFLPRQVLHAYVSRQVWDFVLISPGNDLFPGGEAQGIFPTDLW